MQCGDLSIQPYNFVAITVELIATNPSGSGNVRHIVLAMASKLFCACGLTCGACCKVLWLAAVMVLRCTAMCCWSYTAMCACCCCCLGGEKEGTEKVVTIKSDALVSLNTALQVRVEPAPALYVGHCQLLLLCCV